MRAGVAGRRRTGTVETSCRDTVGGPSAKCMACRRQAGGVEAAAARHPLMLFV